MLPQDDDDKGQISKDSYRTAGGLDRRGQRSNCPTGNHNDRFSAWQCRDLG